MKKILTVIISTLLLFSCLGFASFAAESSVTISEDYQKLYRNGDSYSRVDTTMLEIESYMPLGEQIEFSLTQQETIKSINLDTNEYENIICADITFRDGASLSVDFLRDDYAEAYQALVNGQDGQYIIDFLYPEGNIVKTEHTSLFGASCTLSADDYNYCEYYNVSAKYTDGKLSAIKGALLIIDEKYYYVDYAEAGVLNWSDFTPYEYLTLPAHEITDTGLVQNIKDAEELYYADDLGFLYDDHFTESISAVFLIIIFAIIPFALFVTFLILAIRAKSIYKKMFRTIYLLSGSIFAIFAIIATMIL